MKRKCLIKSCLLGAALLLGTGYAVINNKEVTINGTVSAEVREVDVSVSASSDIFTMTCEGALCTLTQKETYKFDEVYDGGPVYFNFTNNETNIAVDVEFELISVSSPCFYVEIGSIDTSYKKDSFRLGVEQDSVYESICNINMVSMPITEAESTCEIVFKVTFTPTALS